MGSIDRCSSKHGLVDRRVDELGETTVGSEQCYQSFYTRNHMDTVGSPLDRRGLVVDSIVSPLPCIVITVIIPGPVLYN